jgi:hypothetical protein
VQVTLDLVAPNGTQVATGRSASNGDFTIAAPAGSYTLEARPGSGPFPRCSPVQVSIAPGAYTTVNMSCDTGIR